MPPKSLWDIIERLQRIAIRRALGCTRTCIATASFGYKGIPGFCGIYGDMTGRKVLKRGSLQEIKRKKEHEKREEAYERSYPAKIRLKGEGVR